MKRSETIALYTEAFLEGKDDVARQKFEAKNDNQKYAAIMTWKRRKALSSASEKPSAATVITSLKNIKKTIAELSDLPSKDSEKILALLDAIREDVNNFEYIKKGQLLKKLRNQRSSLDREIEQLENEGVKEC